MSANSFVFSSAVLALFVSTASLPAQDQRAEKLREGLKDASLVGTWIYDDIKAGFSQADRSGKPLLIVFR